MSTPRPPATPEFGSVLAGGPAHAYPAKDDCAVLKFSVGPYDNNVYVISSGGEALIVDGAAEPDRILREVSELTVKGIVQTHGHHDHVQALPVLVDELHTPVFAHRNDAMPVPSEPLLGGERLSIGRMEVEVLHTPGHTPGSLCFRLGGHLFTGDTLFPGGPGKTAGHREFQEIMRSLETLFREPDETRVSPGHGLDTTIGRERPQLGAWAKRGW